MKILFLQQFPPPIHGASIVNQNIRDIFSLSSDFKCCFINISPAVKFSDLGTMNFSKALKSGRIILKTLWALVTFRPKIVYITLSPHGAAFLKDSILVLLSKLMGAKPVLHLHGKGIKQGLDRSRFKRLFYNIIFNNVHVIHLSPLLIFDVEDLVDTVNISILPNGVSDTALNIDRREKDIRCPYRIIYLSNLIREKGSLDLLHSISLLDAFDRPVEFFFVGKFSDKIFERDFRHELNQLNHSHSIHLIEGLYGDEKAELLSSSDLFVMPTYYPKECFPLSLLEAFCHGVPVISTDEGAIRDIVQDGVNGLLVDKRSPMSIAKALDLLLRDPARLKMMKNNARESYEHNYSLSQFEVGLVSIFLRLGQRA